jgi:glycosyltransferase involved in cell wall biosynthesis
MIDEFDFSAFVSEREADHLPEQQRKKVLYVQNGIDLDSYKPETSKKPSHNIVFTGVMDYFPNVDAVMFFSTRVFPRIRQRFPDARFFIVGSNPVRAVRDLASIPGIVVTGTVPDVRPFLAQAHVSVAPLRISQGIQNKILQALAAGLPVVASPNAAAGLSHTANLPLVIAEKEAAFAQAVMDFLARPRLSAEEIRRCRRQLKTHYHWSKNLDMFEKAIKSLTPDLDPSWIHTVGAVAACIGSSL